jgi:hypothetical protein
VRQGVAVGRAISKSGTPRVGAFRMSAKFELHHICSIRTLPPLPAWGRGATRTGGLHRFRLFRQRALRWQLLLVLVEFGLLVGCVYGAAVLRYWGDLDAQTAFRVALHWRAPLVAVVPVLSMTALGLYQVHLRVGWLGRLSRQGVAFLLGGAALMVPYYALPQAYIGRGVFGITLALGYLVVALWRVLFLGFVDADLFKRRVVMLGRANGRPKCSARCAARPTSAASRSWVTCPSAPTR